MVWVPDNLIVSVVGTLVIWFLIGLWVYSSKKRKKRNKKSDE